MLGADWPRSRTIGIGPREGWVGVGGAVRLEGNRHMPQNNSMGPQKLIVSIDTLQHAPLGLIAYAAHLKSINELHLMIEGTEIHQ